METDDKVDVYHMILEIIAEWTSQPVDGVDPKTPILTIPGVGQTAISYILQCIEQCEVGATVLDMARRIKANPEGFVAMETTIGEFASILTAASSVLTHDPTLPTAENQAPAVGKPPVPVRPEVNLDGVRWSRVGEKKP